MIVILLGVGAALVYFLRNARRDRGFRPELAPVGWVDGTRWSVVAPLARVETRRLLLHPAFITGMVITPLLLLLATARDAGDDWIRVSQGIALGLAPFGWFVIAATQLLTTRPSRTGADSLLSSLPAPQPTRTAAVLATMGGSVAVAGLFAIANVLFLLLIEDRVIVGSPDIGEIATGVMLAAGAVTVGVAIGRFLPHPLFAVGGAIAVILIQARFLEPTTWPWNTDEASPVRFFGFLAENTSARPELEYRPAAWHLVYLVGLTAVMVVVGLARNGVTRPLAGALAGAVGCAALGGWMQAHPAPAGRVAEMVRFLEAPAAHQKCEERTSGRYCVFDRRADFLAQWDARATDLLALVPRAPGRLVVAERVPTIVGNKNCTPIPFTDSLIPAVAHNLDPERVWSADHAVHPGSDYLPCSSTSVHGLFFAVQVGSWAVGLPSSPRAGNERCYADGEARSALALWLGAAATPGGATRLARLEKEERGYHFRFTGWTDPPMFGVHFALSDARVAVAMADRPAKDVAAAVAPHWARLTAPGTPTSELVSLLALANTASSSPALTPACA
jgi:hypothetical protein